MFDQGQTLVFVVEKVSFDSLENRLDSAVSHELLSCSPTREGAEAYCRVLRGESKPCKGWNRQMYPQFNIIEIPVVH